MIKLLISELHALEAIVRLGNGRILSQGGRKMTLEKDEILVENLRRSLDFYQQAIVWSMTAASVCLLLSLRLRNPNSPPIEVLYGVVNVSFGWAVAFAATFVFGIVAWSAIENVARILGRMSVEEDLREAVLMYPSFATNPNKWVRFGTALLPPFLGLVASGIELINESHLPGGQPLLHRSMGQWVGCIMWLLVLFGPYEGIIRGLRSEFAEVVVRRTSRIVIHTKVEDPEEKE
ncbi:hypothetical protein [Tunturiibacter lichenicola]|uniref:hypothetical protein n=1 Tax=Tunturiibacter lichenicola TaxID=2051959 RepID=UPI003D9BF5C2